MPTIVTNNQYRDVVPWYMVPLPVIEDEFDYLDLNKLRSGKEYAEFVKYKGEWYHLGDLERSSIEGWDNMVTETFFSGVLFKWASDFEAVVVGRYYS